MHDRGSDSAFLLRPSAFLTSARRPTPRVAPGCHTPPGGPRPLSDSQESMAIFMIGLRQGRPPEGRRSGGPGTVRRASGRGRRPSSGAEVVRGTRTGGDAAPGICLGGLRRPTPSAIAVPAAGPDRRRAAPRPLPPDGGGAGGGSERTFPQGLSRDRGSRLPTRFGSPRGRTARTRRPDFPAKLSAASPPVVGVARGGGELYSVRFAPSPDEPEAQTVRPAGVTASLRFGFVPRDRLPN
jgi:hypothetical protein